MRQATFAIALLIILAVSVSAEPDKVTVTGKVVSVYSGNPVPNMEISVWDGFSLVEDLGNTNDNGDFSVTFDMAKAKQSDKGDGQSNYYFRLTKDCYVGPDILIYNMGTYWAVSVPYIHKNIANAVRIESSSINVGNVPINSMADFELNSDLEVKSSYSWKFLNEKDTKDFGSAWAAGGYDSVFRKEIKNAQRLSLDSYVRFRLLDKKGNVHTSPIYYVPIEECQNVKVDFMKGKFLSNLEEAESVIEWPFSDNGVNIPVSKGWNLLPSSALRPLGRSQVQLESFRAAFFYLTPLKEYIRILQNEMQSHDIFISKLMEKGKDENWVRGNIMSFYNLGGWFYSDKEGEITIRMGEEFIPFDRLTLSEGWNFKVITPDLEGKSYKDVKGNCNIERVAAWNAEKQGWSIIPFDDNEKFDDSLYSVKSIKVDSDCTLGVGSIVEPPQLPG
ncbi:hypothetical protein J4401_03700 [Candidatus Woesearchaeota archaeon]|nr:hypothetical protein [Candidatus Woesearchaeota archaeon]